MCIIEKFNLNSSNQIGKRVVEGEEVMLGFKSENWQNISDLEITKQDFEFDDSDLQ